MDYYSDKLDQLQFQEVYENTHYYIADPHIDILCGDYNPTLDIYMRKLGKRSWVFISAANPQSNIQSDQINGWANANLEIDLFNQNYAYTYAIGQDRSGEWPAEDSFVVFDISIDDALRLAKKYNQNAILMGHLNGKADLKWCTT